MMNTQSVTIEMAWDADLASSQVLADLLTVLNKAAGKGDIVLKRDDQYYRVVYDVRSKESVEREAIEQARRDAEIEAERAAEKASAEG